MPMGVVTANSTASVGLSNAILLFEMPDVLEREDGRAAIRIPRERPSKSWWNMIAATREAVRACMRNR